MLTVRYASFGAAILTSLAYYVSYYRKSLRIISYYRDSLRIRSKAKIYFVLLREVL
jgi:hypothetical protein